MAIRQDRVRDVKRSRNSRHIEKHAFALGALSVLDLSGTILLDAPYEAHFYNNDAAALRSDQKQVSKDIEAFAISVPRFFR